MKYQLKCLALALLLCSCAATSIEKTWKSPSGPAGPVRKVAVLAVADRDLVRLGLENRLAREIGARGQAALTTAQLLSLTRIKEDKAAAAALLRQEGADSILIMRLVDKSTYERLVRATPEAFAPVATGYGNYGWHDYYSVAFMDMSVSYSNMRDYLVLDSSLFDLNTGKRLWSVVTQTVVKENEDRLVLADKLAVKVAAQLLKDGMIR